MRAYSEGLAGDERRDRMQHGDILRSRITDDRRSVSKSVGESETLESPLAWIRRRVDGDSHRVVL
jgi:hypothetical protein